MKKCPYCNAQIEDGSLFCEVCGKQQPQGKVCTHCGAAINDGDMFCQGCGASTVGAPPAAPPPRVEQEVNSTGMKQPNQKKSSKGNVLLFVIIGIFLFVALFLGAGWIYYSKYLKPRSSVVDYDVELASLAEKKGLHSEEDADVKDEVSIDAASELPVEEADSDMPAGNIGAFDIDAPDETTSEAAKEVPIKQEPPKEDNKVYDVVEEMPYFPGGPSGLFDYLNKNMKYPTTAEENGIQGRVIVSFVVERDGSVTNTMIVKSVDSSLDQEAVRLVNSMPKWNPGKQNGSTVRVKYTVPITFKLQ